jgi:hypothetical protein
MSYASKLGRARISAKNPQAAAVCDRCGGVVNHVALSWQFDWAGSSLINKRILVCDHCMDTPQQQLRTIVLPADPPVIMNARPEYYVQASTDYRTTQGNTVNAKTGIPVPGGDTRVTEDNDPRVPQQTGFANGSLNNFPGTDPNAPGNDDPGLPYDNTTVPEVGFIQYLQNPWNDSELWNDLSYWNE